MHNVFYDIDIPDKLMLCEPKLLEGLAKYGISTQLKPIKKPTDINIHIGTILSRLEDGYSIYQVKKVCNDITVDQCVANIVDMYYPTVDIEDSTKYLVILMVLVAKNEDEAVAEYERVIKLVPIDQFESLDDWSYEYYNRIFNNGENLIFS